MMKIIDNIKDTGVRADELDAGTVFRFDGDFYLVAEDENSTENIFVNLTDFASAPCSEWSFSDKNVQVVKATLTLDNY